jgi:hypothetical protein
VPGEWGPHPFFDDGGTLQAVSLSILVMLRVAAVRGWPWRAGRRARGRKVPARPELGLAAAERELSVPERRWARGVPAVAEPPSATGTWLAAGSLDSHLGGARTLTLPGRIGPATRESA